MTHLFSPLTLRGVTLSNRIAVSPMCTYGASDGVATDWHLVHLGSRATGGAGLIIQEATAVAPIGRISPNDLGLWDDNQIEAQARINHFIHAEGAIAGVQIGHAGRKAGAWPPGKGTGTIPQNDGGWQSVAPSAIAFGEGFATPRALTRDEIVGITGEFVAAARRALAAGFRVLELHAAHGYLLHQFHSPFSNQRSDEYGGSFENRTRFTRETVRSIRKVWPDQLPLLVRLSATEWVEGGWSVEETVALSRLLKDEGVDLIDVSSGGGLPIAPIPLGPGYQTALAERVRREAEIASSAVGLITSAEQADHIIRTGQADLILLGRELLRDPYWPLHAAKQLEQTTSWPPAYLRAAPAGSTPRQPL